MALKFRTKAKRDDYLASLREPPTVIKRKGQIMTKQVDRVPCPKCGSNQTTMTYRPVDSAWHGRPTYCRIHQEHFSRDCSRCLYRWCTTDVLE